MTPLPPPKTCIDCGRDGGDGDGRWRCPQCCADETEAFCQLDGLQAKWQALLCAQLAYMLEQSRTGRLAELCVAEVELHQAWQATGRRAREEFREELADWWPSTPRLEAEADARALSPNAENEAKDPSMTCGASPSGDQPLELSPTLPAPHVTSGGAK